MTRQEKEAVDALTRVARELIDLHYLCQEIGYGPLTLEDITTALQALSRCVAVIEGRA
jgi:hypothetical protein